MFFLLLHTFLDGNKHHGFVVSGVIILTFIQTIADDHALENHSENIVKPH